MKNNKELTVNKANELIQNFQTDLTRQEWDIFDFIIANIKSPFVYDSNGKKMEMKDSTGKVISMYDTEFNELRFTFKDFSRLVYGKPNPSGKDYETFEKAVDRLENRRSKKIQLTQGDKAGYSTTLKLVEKKYDRGKNADKDIILKLDNDMIPYLLQLKNGYEYDLDGNMIDKPTPFTSYKLDYKLRLKTKYAKRLYEVLKSYENLKGGIYPSNINGISIDDFKKILSIPEGYKYSNIKIRVLDEAINQINDNTDIHVSYREIKDKKRVIALRFKIEKQNDSKIARAIENASKNNIIFKNLTEEKFMNYFEIDTVEKYNDVSARVYENVYLINDLPQGIDLGLFLERYMQQIMDNVVGVEIKNKWRYLRKILENDYKEAVKATKGTSNERGVIDNTINIKEVFLKCKNNQNVLSDFSYLSSDEKNVVQNALELNDSYLQLSNKEVIEIINNNNFDNEGIPLELIIDKKRMQEIKEVQNDELQNLINEVLE